MTHIQFFGILLFSFDKRFISQTTVFFTMLSEDEGMSIQVNKLWVLVGITNLIPKEPQVPKQSSGDFG